MKFGCMGDGVNLCSRLEELNKRYSTQVIISHATHELHDVASAFLCRPLDYVAVKGSNLGTMVFEVMARAEVRWYTAIYVCV